LNALTPGGGGLRARGGGGGGGGTRPNPFFFPIFFFAGGGEFFFFTVDIFLGKFGPGPPPKWGAGGGGKPLLGKRHTHPDAAKGWGLEKGGGIKNKWVYWEKRKKKKRARWGGG